MGNGLCRFGTSIYLIFKSGSCRTMFFNLFIFSHSIILFFTPGNGINTITRIFVIVVLIVYALYSGVFIGLVLFYMQRPCILI